MSNENEPYARVYHAKLQREFPLVWRDDAMLSAWLRLHSVADASWPMHPPLPRSIRPRVLARLVEVGLVVTDGETYTTRGLDAERSTRSESARNAAAKRWQSKGNAGAYAVAMPTRPDPTQPETNSDSPPPPTSGGRRKDGTNPRANGTAPRQNGHAPRDHGESPRQVKRAEKRDPTPIHEILSRAAKAGR